MKQEQRNEWRAIRVLLAEVGFVALCIVLLISLVFFGTKENDSYDEEMVHKEVLLQSAPSPRIIFVGGSGLAFGLDSSLVASSTGLHPVNLGMYGSFGLDNLFQQVESGMKKGDTVVIIPEYRLIEGNTADRGMQLLGLLQADIGFIRYVGEKRDISAILRSLPSWCSNQITYEIKQMSDHLFGVRINNPYRALHRKVYRASSFDQYGDMLGHLGQASQTQNMWKESKLSGNIPEDVRTNLAEFLVRANQQGVTVFFSWPAFSKTSFEQNRQEIEQLSTQITQILGKKNVLGAPGDFNWNDDAYFDSVYHLSGPAREERTKKLIALLRRAQNPK